MTTSAERFSPKRLARILGLIGLAGIVTGAFDIGYVQVKLVVENDPAATLQNILAHQTLFRLGLAAHLFELCLNIPGEIIGFYLFRRVNVLIAGVALCCGIVGVAVEAVALLFQYAPLQIAMGASALAAFTPEQLNATTLLAEQLQRACLLFSWVFYGVDELASGFLYFRSGFFPRILGFMLGLSGFCYFTHGLLRFIAPVLDARIYPYIIYPCLPGEGLSSLWLAIMGVNVVKWRAWSNTKDEEAI